MAMTKKQKRIASVQNSLRYQRRNKNKIRTYMRKWRKKNRVKIRKAFLRWYSKYKKLRTTKIGIRQRHWKTAYGLLEIDVLTFLQKQKYSCVFCGVKLSLLTCSIDHKVPKSKGGSNSKKNLQLTCLPCNWAKRNLTSCEYLKQCQRVVTWMREKSSSSKS